MSRRKDDPGLLARRRAQIVEGARRCFGRLGFHDTGVEDLEEDCRLTRGTLFRYFPDKEAMLLAVIEAEVSRRDRAFESALAGLDGCDLREVVHALVRAQLDLSRRDPWGLRLRLELKSLAERDPRVASGVARLERRQRGWRRGMVAALQRRGLIAGGWRPDDATDLVSVVFLGLSVDRAYRFPGRTTDARLAALAATMLAGILDAPPPAAGGQRRRGADAGSAATRKTLWSSDSSNAAGALSARRSPSRPARPPRRSTPGRARRRSGR